MFLKRPNQNRGRVPRFGVAACLLLALVSSCSGPPRDGSTALSKKLIFDEVDKALTIGDCNTAVDKIQPLYNSANTDNSVRLKAASAYGCDARINFFKLVGDIAARSTDIMANNSSGFWQVMTEFFPSEAGKDYVVEGAYFGTDALQAALAPGAVILPMYQVNPTSYNPGSVFTTDRVSDANIYLVFMSMAAIGGVQNRYGVPNPATFKKTIDLTWTKADAAGIENDGCAYAASILNFVDSVEALSGVVGGDTSATLTTIAGTFKTGLNAACRTGCYDAAALPPAGAPLHGENWVATGCTAAVKCEECPKELRDRTRCTRDKTNPISCAAAGLVNYINETDYGWQGP